jgi:hypothetical protein
MNSNMAKRSREMAMGWPVVTLGLLLSTACGYAAARAAQPRNDTAAPDLHVDRAAYPEDDAVILRWEQHWTLHDDGTIRRREHKWTKLLNRRPLRRLGDPRIDFQEDREQLVLHAAQTHLPDDTIQVVPDYARNLTSPDDLAGWPEYIGWRQMVVSFTGLVTGATMELDYEIVTQPGTYPWLEADLRVHNDEPVIQRIVTVTVPAETKLAFLVDRLETPVSRDGIDGQTRYTWVFTDLEASPGEPQSLPWQQRDGRLRFTTCPDAAAWVSARLDAAKEAAQPDDAIRAFAADAVEGIVEPIERVEALDKKLRDSFNIVTSSRTRTSLRCRSAAEVFRSNYGSPLEAAALWTAALRALAYIPQLAVAVDARRWDDAVPTGSAANGLAVTVPTPDGPIHLHPRYGVFANPGAWGRRWLLDVEGSDSVRQTRVWLRGEQAPSRLEMSGTLRIDKDAAATAELRIRLTGAFYDPAKLEDAGKQKALVQRCVDSVLEGFDLKSHTIVALSDDLLRATAEVASTEPLPDRGGQHLLRLGDGPSFLSEIPMPLNRSARRTAVDVRGRFLERVDLTIQLPEGWTAPITPRPIASAKAPWGSAGQTLTVDDNTIRWVRTIHLRQDSLSAKTFGPVRDAINGLRADASLLLTCRP